MKKSHLKQFIKEEIRSVLQESINESSDKRSHIILRVEPRNYENMIDKLQGMNVNHNRVSKNIIKVYTDKTSGWYRDDRAQYKLMHDVWVDKFVVKESVSEELYYTFSKDHSNIGENPQFKEDVIRRVKEHPHMMGWADDDIINKVIKSAEEFYAFKEKGHGGLVPRNRTMSSEEFADAVIAELT